MHNLFGERFLGRDKPGWHNLGQVVPTGTRCVEGLQMIGGDIEIQKMQTYVQIETPFGIDLVGTGEYAIMRAPTPDDNRWRNFGTVSDRFEIIQSRQIAELLDTLTDKWHLETIGLLGKGETLFVTLFTGEYDVAGTDPIKNYFFVTDTQDGRHALKIGFTPVRIVCQNTLKLALNKAQVALDISHFDTAAELAGRINLMGKMQQAQAESLEVLNAMAGIVLAPEQIDQVFEAAYPYPKEPRRVQLFRELSESGNQGPATLLLDKVMEDQKEWEYNKGRADILRDGAHWLMEKWNDEQPALAQTAWGAYNVVAESADWREGRSDEVNVSPIFGSRALEKERAFRACLEFVK